jgi:O-antigen ligase
MTTSSAQWAVDWWRPGATPVPRVEPIAADAGSAVPFWALIALTVVMLLAPQEFIPSLAPLRIALMSAFFAASTYAFDRWTRGEALLTVGPEMRWCLVLVAWAVCTIPFSIWPGGSLHVLVDLYIKSVIVFGLLGSIVRSTGRLRQVAWTLSLIALPMAVTGIMHFALGEFSKTATHEGRILGWDAGLVKNPNDLALVLNLILPLTVALMMTERAGRARLLLIAIVVCEVAGVVVTFSRSGFITLALIGALLAWRFTRRRGSRWVWAALTLAILALPALPATYLERLSTIADKDADKTGSAQARWTDQLVAAGYVADHPLIGAGMGNDVLAMNELRGATWRQVHNLYLEYAVDLGLPGLALFVILLTRCLKAVSIVQQRCAAAGAGVLFALAEGVWISLMAFATAAFFHPIAYHVYFYYFAGLAVAVKATYRAEVAA